MSTFSFIDHVFTFAAELFVFAVGLGFLMLVYMYLYDRFQKKHAIRRNYPLVGRFRYIFEHMGEFFRQYFFALDDEEKPFTRLERTWVYRAAKEVDTTLAFGSTSDSRTDNKYTFVHSDVPVLASDKKAIPSLTIGENSCQNPYTAHSLFNISGMSFGAISQNAVLALSSGAKLANCYQNTGEGGLSKYHVEGGGDQVYQIGTGKFGVSDEKGRLSDERLKVIANNDVVKMFELKLSQGAKPGKGGILPAAKVTADIAEARNVEVGVNCFSPNRHPEINSIDDLLEMLHRIRNASGIPVGFKFAMGDPLWPQRLCEAILKKGLDFAPDFITVDSADGGSGAAPKVLMESVGILIDESLPVLVNALIASGLRDRIKVIASGKLITPSSVAWALAMGADLVNSARGNMFALGCIQALQCNTNKCPSGVATQNKKLQRGLDPQLKKLRVASYIQQINDEVQILANSCGVNDPRQLRRNHVRIVRDFRTHSMEDIFPYPDSSSE